MGLDKESVVADVQLAAVIVCLNVANVAKFTAVGSEFQSLITL